MNTVISYIYVSGIDIATIDCSWGSMLTVRGHSQKRLLVCQSLSSIIPLFLV